MAKKKLPEDRKYNITFRLPYWLVKEIKETHGYNRKIEEILSKYFKRQNTNENK